MEGIWDETKKFGNLLYQDMVDGGREVGVRMGGGRKRRLRNWNKNKNSYLMYPSLLGSRTKLTYA